MLRGDRERMLEARCLVARATGYLRGAAHANLPHWFSQPAMADMLDFRSERRQLSQAQTP